nr:MAG TPA: hypothetical protein [Caudoviricetes sp.]
MIRYIVLASPFVVWYSVSITSVMNYTSLM